MWKGVLFSDESSVQQFSVQRYWVWRPTGSCYEEKYTAPTVQYPPNRMIWGAMSFMETAGLYFLPPETTINGEKYVNLLKSELELPIRVHNCEIFMHDGAPCHQSKVVKKFLEQKCIQIFEW